MLIVAKRRERLYALLQGREKTIIEAMNLDEKGSSLGPIVVEGVVGYLRSGALSELDTMAETLCRVGDPLPLADLVDMVGRFSSACTPIILTADDNYGAIPELLGVVHISTGIGIGKVVALREQRRDEGCARKEREVAMLTQLLCDEEDRAERALATRSYFLNNINHELRTPLTIIQGFARILSRGSIDLKQVPTIASRIENAGESLLRMLSDLILMTRLQSGMAKAEYRYLYLDELVDEGIRFHCNNELVNDRMFVVSKKQERLMVSGDFEMLKVMVAHLVSNATKFSGDDSKVTISIKSDGNGFARIEVIDEGIGVDLEEVEQLFAPFHQKDLSIRRRYEGAGLWLSLARLIARHHGGDIVVAHRADAVGSIFTVMLPFPEKK